MREQPILNSDRLLLRPFTFTDAPRIQNLAGKREIADTTVSIPHPYSLSRAEEWIAGHPREFSEGKATHFAIECKEIQQLIGAIALRDIEREHLQGELGYWVGVEFWGRGYASEAARTAIAYGFEVLHLHRIYAYHMARNSASGRVLQKLGMRQEGLLRDRVRKWDIFEDVCLYAILEEEWRDTNC
ncbi:MAG: GNAT family N-acetyltransferase [Cyanobacteria bacterium SBLK]|nr:GNAT family N-acetyltransferase [Cyanobacteria bacterium SBLK]